MTNIIDFQNASQHRACRSAVVLDQAHDPQIAIRLTDWHADRLAKRERFEPTTETGKNLRDRQRRDYAWRRAKTAVDYWRAKMEFEDAWINAARDGIVRAPKPGEISTRDANVSAWRQALVDQMLTPAPTLNDVEWKRRTFAAGQHQHIGADPAAIKRAIERDAAWLQEHPVRRSRPVDPAAVAERKQADCDIRGRIKEVAASLHLSEDAIRPALSLRNRMIAGFIREHGISADWLLTGIGHVFQADRVNH
ncbi:hypothetical protein [Bradyrhizobium sp. HKCCYLS2033]|uniref:hypothetical protein n=1 Tax=Bradyrhizobium sp. HKCCYLS2033 TaxID=3420739 RepID=UPI003EBF4CAB